MTMKWLRMAIIGMFYQDGLTGSAWGDWASYTDSPLRAFENETGSGRSRSACCHMNDPC